LEATISGIPLRKTIILFLAAAQFLMPIIVQSKESIDAIIQQAHMDAKEDINSFEWLSSGFLIMPLAVITAKVYTPQPPSSRLNGKSTRYLKMYRKPYENKAKAIQTKYALLGCLSGIIFWSSAYFAAKKLGILSNEKFM
jgi:hypothetical protein